MALDTGDDRRAAQEESGRELLGAAAYRLIQVMPRVFKQVMSSCRDRMPEELADAGESQYRLIHALSHEELTISELARRMKVTAPTVSRMVDSLVGKGLVERRPDPADRRIIWLSLTATGRVMSSRLDEIFRAAAARFMGPLSDEQLQMVLGALGVLGGLLQEDLPTEPRESN